MQSKTLLPKTRQMPLQARRGRCRGCGTAYQVLGPLTHEVVSLLVGRDGTGPMGLVAMGLEVVSLLVRLVAPLAVDQMMRLTPTIGGKGNYKESVQVGSD